MLSRAKDACMALLVGKSQYLQVCMCIYLQMNPVCGLSGLAIQMVVFS